MCNYESLDQRLCGLEDSVSERVSSLEIRVGHAHYSQLDSHQNRIELLTKRLDCLDQFVGNAQSEYYYGIPEQSHSERIKALEKGVGLPYMADDSHEQRLYELERQKAAFGEPVVQFSTREISLKTDRFIVNGENLLLKIKQMEDFISILARNCTELQASLDYGKWVALRNVPLHDLHLKALVEVLWLALPFSILRVIREF